MRIPDVLFGCVCFLGRKSNAAKAGEPISYGGTGFFVQLESEFHPGNFFGYVVTARHSVSRPNFRLFMRLNTSSGGSQTFELSGDWDVSPSADVAVFPWASKDSRYQFQNFPVTRFVTDSLIAAEGIGPGDEIFVTGLFTSHYGEHRNQPIVRSGIISALPGDPMQMEYQPGPAYLAEVRSIGGLSGSPVFVRLPVGRVHGGKINLKDDRIYLLGLVHGHWNFQNHPVGLSMSPPELERLNMGMAIVVPSAEILRVLNSERLVDQRKTQNPFGRSLPPATP